MYQQQSTVAVLILVMPLGEGFSQIEETKPFAEIKITAQTQKKMHTAPTSCPAYFPAIKMPISCTQIGIMIEPLFF